jgi:hypothetical protein
MKSLIKEEAVSRKLMSKFRSSDQKEKKGKAIWALEVRLKALTTRAEKDEIIDRKQYVEGLSFFLPITQSSRLFDIIAAKKPF